MRSPKCIIPNPVFTLTKHYAKSACIIHDQTNRRHISLLGHAKCIAGRNIFHPPGLASTHPAQNRKVQYTWGCQLVQAPP
jgi:hypothetical protein